MASDAPQSIELGQFEDAPISVNESQGDPRAGGHFIDDEALLAWSEPENSADEDEDEVEEEYDDNRAEDEDWEVAEGDFTKQYNRLRQHVAVRTGNAQGVTNSINKKAAVASLPAVNHPRPSTSVSSITTTPKDKTTDQLAALVKYSSRIAKIDQPYAFVMGAGVNRKGPSAHANVKDKADRATNEQVLDPRTRIILFKMIGRGLVQEVNGCVSTGKEANVYHALAPEPTCAHLALKIYKTSILIFKDRDRYVSGEHRFRRGYSRHNPRKMVRLWAEKEMRNLKRLVSAGIPCPTPVEVRENVLVMSFLGDKEGWASPRLKDAQIPAEGYPPLYEELLLNIRTMFNTCRLVHADLSEYNILYHEGHLCIIDVSQSVEHDHPSAFDFLRNDLKNVEEFFGRAGVKTLGLRRCFEYVTREKITSEDGEDEVAALKRWLQEEVQPDEEGDNEAEGDAGREEAAHEDEVFMRSYIPRTLNEVYDPERDVEALKKGGTKGLIYADTIGLVEPEGKPKVHFNEGEGSSSDDGGDSESGEDGDVTEDEAGADGKEYKERILRGHRHEDKEAKAKADLMGGQERKRVVKAEAREKRKNKIPKAEKKRKIKNSRG
ncbi:hypothetical protein HWV62_269 [Athelia sp. TMB]|nr:hypothetical protein HWV62_269 [Athelia sp. TMB]